MIFGQQKQNCSEKSWHRCFPACATASDDNSFVWKTSKTKPTKHQKNINRPPLCSRPLKCSSTPQINWLCRWRRRALLSAKCWIERLSRAASHQSPANYTSGIPTPLRPLRLAVKGGDGRCSMMGSYQSKLQIKSNRSSPPLWQHIIHMGKVISTSKNTVYALKMPSWLILSKLQDKNQTSEVIYIWV